MMCGEKFKFRYDEIAIKEYEEWQRTEFHAEPGQSENFPREEQDRPYATRGDLLMRVCALRDRSKQSMLSSSV